MSNEKAASPAKRAAQSDVDYSTTEANGVLTVHRTKGKESKEIARVENGKLSYQSKEARRAYHPQVTRYLNEEGIVFNPDQVAVGDAEDDGDTEEGEIDFSKAPRRTPEQGDKTPAFVEWMKKNYPKQFEKTYGVQGEATVTRRLKGTDPVTGRPTEQTYQERALISDRKTHLTEKPDALEIAEGNEDQNDL